MLRRARAVPSGDRAHPTDWITIASRCKQRRHSHSLTTSQIQLLHLDILEGHLRRRRTTQAWAPVVLEDLPD